LPRTGGAPPGALGPLWTAPPPLFKPPEPAGAPEMTSEAVEVDRHENVNQTQMLAWETARGRIVSVCQDSFGYKNRLQLTYDVRLHGRSATFDLTDLIVKEGEPLTPELDRCVRTAVSRLAPQLKPWFQDYPSFEGSVDWTFLFGSRGLEGITNTPAGAPTATPTDAR
jgi:hypothetical protein